MHNSSLMRIKVKWDQKVKQSKGNSLWFYYSACYSDKTNSHKNENFLLKRTISQEKNSLVRLECTKGSQKRIKMWGNSCQAGEKGKNFFEKSKWKWKKEIRWWRRKRYG